MDNIMARAWAQIEWEEDEVNERASHPSYDRTSPHKSKHRQKCPKDWRAEPYATAQRTRDRPTNRCPTQRDSTLPPRLNEQNLNISTGDLLLSLSKMGDTVKWPSKTVKPAHQCDKTKLCDFHSDHGHHTPDCIALRLEVVELLKRGHLRELLTQKGKTHFSKELTTCVDTEPAEPPMDARTINVISGASEVSGVTYSSAKRHTRTITPLKPGSKCSQEAVTRSEALQITFFDEETDDLSRPHHRTKVHCAMFGHNKAQLKRWSFALI